MNDIRIETDKNILNKEKFKYLSKAFFNGIVTAVPLILYSSLPEYQNIVSSAGTGLVSSVAVYNIFKNFYKFAKCEPTSLEIYPKTQNLLYSSFSGENVGESQYEAIIDAGIFYPKGNHGVIGVSIRLESEPDYLGNSDFGKKETRTFWIPDVKKPKEKIEMLKPYIKRDYSIDDVVSL
jgi:hypothetical protein